MVSDSCKARGDCHFRLCTAEEVEHIGIISHLTFMVPGFKARTVSLEGVVERAASLQARFSSYTYSLSTCSVLGAAPGTEDTAEN